MAVAELRARIGVLFQDYMAYDLTAAENIGLGDLTALEDGVTDPGRRAAGRHRRVDRPAAPGVRDHAVADVPARASQIRSAMRRDEEGNGVLLSGGQWQRLALARTFLRDRRDLLILDEPSSGLDAQAEHEIHDGLHRHRAGATSLLISHRLGAVRDADRIVVLAGGVIVESGTHRELVGADGEYARLFAMQARNYRPETVDAGSPA